MIQVTQDGEVDLELRLHSPSGAPYFGVQSSLYSWHANDPVDAFESNDDSFMHIKVIAIHLLITQSLLMQFGVQLLHHHLMLSQNHVNEIF